MKLLLLAAMEIELAPVRRRLRLSAHDEVTWRGRVADHDLIAARTGVGAGRAVDALQRLIEAHQPDCIINFGFAGALDPALRVGDIVQPAAVLNEAGRRIDLQNAPGPILLTTDTLIDSAEGKRQLYAQHRAAAVDMESFALAQAARDRGIAIHLLRAVSDDAHTALPAESVRWVAPDGRADAAAAMRYLAAHPWRLGTLLALRRHAAQAGQALAQAVAQLCGNLP